MRAVSGRLILGSSNACVEGMNAASDPVVFVVAVFLMAILAVAVYMLTRDLWGSQSAVDRRFKVFGASSDDDAVSANAKIRRPGFQGPAWLSEALPNIQVLIKQADLDISATAVGLIVVMAFGILFTNFNFFIGMGILPSMSFSLIFGVLVPYLILKHLADKKLKEALKQLPGAIDLIIRSLEAGHPVITAFKLVAKELPNPLAKEFGLLVDEIMYGLDADQAFGNLQKRLPAPEFGFFIVALNIQRQSGGNLVEVLGNLAMVLRERANMQKKAKAVSAEGRWSGIVVACVPVFVGGTIFLFKPEFYTDVAHHPWFFPAMSTAIIFLMIGVFVIWKIVNIKV